MPSDTEDGDVIVRDLNDPDIALKRILKTANSQTMFALILVHRDGRLQVWGDNLETDEQSAWFDRKMSETKALITKRQDK
jgi:hypothetical protein